MFEQYLKQIEEEMRTLAATVKASEFGYGNRVGKAKFSTESEKDPEKKRNQQIVCNYLENCHRRLTAARQILDQSAVLIAQEGEDLLVVTKIDERTRALIELAEKNGGVVVGVVKAQAGEDEPPF
jgi:hypothetical protein